MRIVRDLMKGVVEGDVQHMQIAAVDYLQKFVDVKLDDKGRVAFKSQNTGLSIRFTPMVFIKRGVLKFEECDDGSYTVALECSYGLCGVVGLIVSAGLFMAGPLVAGYGSYHDCIFAIVVWAVLLVNQLCIPGAYLKAAIKKRMLKKKKKKSK